MALRFSDLGPAFSRHAAVVEVSAVAALALGLSLWLGVKAKRQRVEYAAGVERLRSLAQQVDQIRATFKPLTDAEGTKGGAPDDSSGAAIAHTARLALAQSVAQAAEQAGLTGVRVQFLPADSASLPPRPQVGSRPVSAAAYLLAVECDGGFGTLLTFVSNLPSVVTLERIGAIRARSSGIGGTGGAGTGSATVHYRVNLGVYEFANDNRSG